MIEARRAELALDLRCRKPLHALSSRKPLISPPCASDFAQTTKTSAIGELVIQFFAPESAIAAVDLLRPGDHRPGVRAVVGLGQPEATDASPLASPGGTSPAAPRRLGEIGCITSERLHAHRAAVALSRPARPRAPSGRRRRSPRLPRRTPRGRQAEQARRAHRGQHRPVEDLVPKRREHPPRQPPTQNPRAASRIIRSSSVSCSREGTGRPSRRRPAWRGRSRASSRGSFDVSPCRTQRQGCRAEQFGARLPLDTPDTRRVALFQV